MWRVILFCVIGLVYGRRDVFKLQADDTHYLYCDGTLMSSGVEWNKVYTASTAGTKMCATVAIFMENSKGGDKGLMLTVDGIPTDITAWKCTGVESFANANNDYAGWKERYFDTEDWKGMRETEGPQKSFEGGPWMWCEGGGAACICRLLQGDELVLQVDDEYKLFDATGELISSGTRAEDVHYTVGAAPLALYAVNTGGPAGIVIKMNGAAIDRSSIRCKAATGTEAEIDAKNPGWKTASFDSSIWAEAAIAANPTPNFVKDNTKVLWTACECADKVICKIK